MIKILRHSFITISFTFKSDFKDIKIAAVAGYQNYFVDFTLDLTDFKIMLILIDKNLTFPPRTLNGF